jgi:uncharacterized protein YjbJ (UPF0337 family)
MNRDIMEGKWEQVKGSVQKTWGKLTDDDLDQIAGDRRKLAGRIQEIYGVAQDEAEKQLKTWEESFDDSSIM